MQLRSVLRQVVVKLGLDDKVDIEEKMPTGACFDKLMLAGNNIIRELASCYLPLLRREHIVVRDNRFDMSTLERQVVKVVSLRRDGVSHRFKMYPTYMYADNGSYEIEYSYLPMTSNIDDEIEVDIRVNEDILANGIASEYCLMTNDVDLGTVYDRRYRENLKNISINSHEIRVKGRAFV